MIYPAAGTPLGSRLLAARAGKTLRQRSTRLRWHSRAECVRHLRAEEGLSGDEVTRRPQAEGFGASGRPRCPVGFSWILITFMQQSHRKEATLEGHGKCTRNLKGVSCRRDVKPKTLGHQSDSDVPFGCAMAPANPVLSIDDQTMYQGHGVALDGHLVFPPKRTEMG